MSEEFQKTLFDPFTREERSGTNKVQGTGLGMAITKNIVDPLSRIIPTLAMTANAFLEDMQKSREAGMDEHLSKPVDIAALEQTVKRFRVIPPKINSGQARFRRGSTQAM